MHLSFEGEISQIHYTMTDDSRKKAKIEILNLSSHDESDNGDVEIICVCSDDEPLNKKKVSTVLKKLPPKKRTGDINMTNGCQYVKKNMIKEKNILINNDKIVNTHIPHGFESNASPHIVVSQWFHRIERN